ncbi:MAG: class I SAM-dependent methyltransferase [Clostridia bacterium]|nr:class I SAM-dependent methyltransferase [Clostridia bacterium]
MGINKYKDIIVNHYTANYNEDDRFNSRSTRLEYLTTMKYIKEYAKKGCKVLEVGAGTGAYSVELAKSGFDITAVELVPKNVEVMKQKADGLDNIKCLQGDALDLSTFQDNTFDVVLNLGPMYHLYTQDDKDRAIKESVRVCKENGICIFAYLTHSAIVWAFGVRKNSMDALLKAMDKDGRIIDTPEEVFSSYFIEDFNKQFDNMPTTFLKNVATDSIANNMREYIDLMSEEDYNKLINWHFATCERLDQQGLSSHMIYICKKNETQK